VCPLGHPCDAVPRAVNSRPLANGAVVIDLDDERGLAVLDVDDGARAAGMADRVGERLLNDPVGSKVDARWVRNRVAHLFHLHGQPRGTRRGGQLVEAFQARAGCAWGALINLAQHAEHRAELDQGLFAHVVDRRQRAASPFGLAVHQVQRGVRLDIDDRDVVRYHVVQLPGDCQALLARSPAGRFLTASRHRLGPLPAEPQPLGHPEQPQQSGRAAKVIAAALVGLVFGAAGSAVPTGIGLAFVAGHGDAIALAGATIARHAGGAVLGAGLLAAVGVGLGTLVRAQLGAVIGVFAWAFFLEAIVGGLFNSVGPYLPFTATTTLAGSRLGGGGFGFSGSSSATPLPFVAAASLVAGVALVLSAVAAQTALRHAIS
jgi:hypothetical protein